VTGSAAVWSGTGVCGAAVATTSKSRPLYEQYRQARSVLQQAIARAKVQAWDSLVETLNEDPWGCPYKIVRNKLRTWAPPVTESFHPRVLDGVLDELFPPDVGDDAVQREEETTTLVISGAVDPEITWDELWSAVRRMGAKNMAPGPDGVPGRAWALAMSALGERLRRYYNELLSHGWFPQL